MLNDDGLWQHFEDMLGEIDYSEFEEKDFYLDEDSEIDDYSNYAYINEKIAIDAEYIIKDGLDKNFRNWIEDTFENEYPKNLFDVKRS